MKHATHPQSISFPAQCNDEPAQQSSSSSSKLSQEERKENSERADKKIFIAFDYWEQLTMATSH